MFWSAGVLEGPLASQLREAETTLRRQQEVLEYRRRYIMLRPVFRAIFDKFDKQVRSPEKPESLYTT